MKIITNTMAIVNVKVTVIKPDRTVWMTTVMRSLTI